MSKLLAEWFWTDRWMGSSAFLLPLEPRGLYREMLTQAWRRGARLPNDHEAIQRAVGCTKSEWKRCWPQISTHWRVEGSEIVNDTQLEVYAATIEARNRAAERGRKGGKARAQVVAQARAQAEALRLRIRKPPEPEQVVLSNTDRTGADEEDVPKRAQAFYEWYEQTHERVFHIGYMGTNGDWVKTLELCKKFTDSDMRDAALVWFGHDDDFATKGTRTIAKFASRITGCLQTIRAKGIA
jgi:uncharacterized protein YdaU (DUF1376 family)